MTEEHSIRALLVCTLASGADAVDFSEYDLSVAIDGGLAWFRARGVVPCLLVGDGDSSAADDRDWARERGTEIHLVSSDKDYTDFDLALDVCERRGMNAATVIGALGGRMDQQLGVFGSLLRHPTLQTIVRDARQFVVPVFAGATYTCTEEIATFGVVALESAVVTVSNARWPLDSAKLEPLSTWGISNEPQGGQPRVEVEAGVVLFIGQYT